MVSGTTTLDASASNATSVEFQLFGGVYGYLRPDTLYGYGDLLRMVVQLEHHAVPNGSYLLSSLAFNSVGSAYSMGGVNITVNNSDPDHERGHSFNAGHQTAQVDPSASLRDFSVEYIAKASPSTCTRPRPTSRVCRGICSLPCPLLPLWRRIPGRPTSSRVCITRSLAPDVVSDTGRSGIPVGAPWFEHRTVRHPLASIDFACGLARESLPPVLARLAFVRSDLLALRRGVAQKSIEHRHLKAGMPPLFDHPRRHSGMGCLRPSHGGPYRTRTCDPLRVMQVRYQLRQRPVTATLPPGQLVPGSETRRCGCRIEFQSSGAPGPESLQLAE